jgi:endonuclease/exonuclease/phosphatase family metal-dependent hydrolase
VANISVMSYNILWQPESKCTWKERAPTLLRAVQERLPNIMCMQEVSAKMYNDLVHMLPLYGSTFGIHPGSSFGCATFFLLETMTSVTLPHNILGSNKQHKKPRVIAHITTLECLSSRQRIVVCNTHLLYGFDDYMECMRDKSVLEIKDVLQSAQYQELPQMIGGDFNSKPSCRALQQVEAGKNFSNTYHAIVHKNPEFTVEAYQHGQPISVDYLFTTKHFTPVSVLLMPTIASMRNTQLPIPGFEASDHLYHFARYNLKIY